MNDQQPVFIADSCIGGLSVVKSMWESGYASDAIFLADYVVNPLGVKSDSDIATVVKKWLNAAETCSDTLIIACNTLSVRYYQLLRSKNMETRLENIVTMVDCFEVMVNKTADQLENKNILVIGTAFTASQSVYPDILQSALHSARVDTIAATKLEQKIARFQPWDFRDDSVFTPGLRRAIENCDVAILACTCFPMAKTQLENQFPNVFFLDPGVFSESLLPQKIWSTNGKLSINISGEVVSSKQVSEFATAYLDRDVVVS